MILYVIFRESFYLFIYLFLVIHAHSALTDEPLGLISYIIIINIASLFSIVVTMFMVLEIA